MKYIKDSSAKLRKPLCVFTIIAMFLIANLLNTQWLYAQNINPGANKKLKVFEGFYQSRDNKDAFLKITAKGDSLVLQQLWDQKEFPFEQTAALEFYCKAQSFPLKFKDSAGTITQVLAFNRDIWNKVKGYKPPVHKEVQLTSKQLQSLERKYKMQGGDADDILQITYQGNNLILKQLWDNQVITFKPESPLDFYCKDRMFPLKFSKDKNGIVTQVLAFNKDVWIKMNE
jgi:hypothetical protein